jgi:hypothetical protein
MKVAQICNSHGWHHSWSLTPYSHFVFRKIVEQVEELYDGHCIVVDGTWLPIISTEEKFTTLYPNVMRENIEHIFFISLIDPPYEYWRGEERVPCKQQIVQLTSARNRHDMPAKSDFQFCAWWIFDAMKRYKGTSLPWTGDKLFLSYNRKPHKHREQLFRTLTSSGLLCEGLVSMGNTDPAKAITVGKKEFEHKETPAKELIKAPGNVGIPNDITSLGNHDIWQQAFINVVTETTTEGRFLSEKIWKPIIGKRPFMLVGPPDQLTFLQEMGFKTFDNFWDESYNLAKNNESSIDHIVTMLKNMAKLSHKEQYQMYQEMIPILEHNHQHFFGEFAQHNESLLSTIVRDEM